MVAFLGACRKCFQFHVLDSIETEDVVSVEVVVVLSIPCIGFTMRSGALKVEIFRYKRFETMMLVVAVYDFASNIAVEMWNELDYRTGGEYIDRILDFLSHAENYELYVEEH